MQLSFVDDHVVASPGQTVELEFLVENDKRAPLTCDFQLQTGDRALQPEWCEIIGPGGLSHGQRGTGRVVVRLPAQAGPPEGTYRLRVEAIDRSSRQRAQGGFELEVERGSCVRVVGEPSLSRPSNARLTASLTLVNCGAMEVTGVVSIRHEDDWELDLDDPRFTLSVGEDPREITVSAQLPDDRPAREGDEVTVEVATADQSVQHTARIPEQDDLFSSPEPPAPRRPEPPTDASEQDTPRQGPRRWVVALIAGASVLIAAAGVAVLFFPGLREPDLTAAGDAVDGVSDLAARAVQLATGVFGGDGAGATGPATAEFAPGQTVDFKAVVVGTSRTQRLIITNAGGQPLTVGEVAMTRQRPADGSAFTLEDEDCTDDPIRPEASCGITLVYQPPGAGDWSATLVVEHDGDGPEEIELTGSAGPDTPPPARVS